MSTTGDPWEDGAPRPRRARFRRPGNGGNEAWRGQDFPARQAPADAYGQPGDGTDPRALRGPGFGSRAPAEFGADGYGAADYPDSGYADGPGRPGFAGPSRVRGPRAVPPGQRVARPGYPGAPGNRTERPYAAAEPSSYPYPPGGAPYPPAGLPYPAGGQQPYPDVRPYSPGARPYAPRSGTPYGLGPAPAALPAPPAAADGPRSGEIYTADTDPYGYHAGSLAEGRDAAGSPGPAGYGPPAAGYGPPAAGYRAPAAGYRAPADGYRAPAPGYGAPGGEHPGSQYRGGDGRAAGYGGPPGSYGAAPAPRRALPGPGAPPASYGGPPAGYPGPANGYGRPIPPAVPGGPGYEFGYGGGPEPVEPRAPGGRLPGGSGAGREPVAADDFTGPGNLAGPGFPGADGFVDGAPTQRFQAGRPGYEFGYRPAAPPRSAPAGPPAGDRGDVRAGYAGASAGYAFTPTVTQPPGAGGGYGQDRLAGPPGFEFTGPIRAVRPLPRQPLALPAGGDDRRDDEDSLRPRGWARLGAAFRQPVSDDPKAPPPPLSAAGVKRWALRVALPVMSAVAVGIAAFATFGGSSGATGPAPSTLSLGFPSATSAVSDFTTTPADASRGIEQSLSRVASVGPVVVATGSQAGARIGRAQFFVSTDGGRTWQLATEQAQAGGDPPPGHPATQIAGGPGAWLAIGPDAIWTSQDGKTWTLAATQGITPIKPGDRVNVLKRTGAGFLAAGENAGHPVIWTSANGVTWQRFAGAQLRLPAAGAVGGIAFAAATAKATVISGTVTKGTGRGATRIPGVWRSTDGGGTWTAVNIPVSNGAQNAIVGLASTANGLVAIRPGVSRQAGADAVAYFSADGAAWKFGDALTSQGGLTVGPVSGGGDGAVVTGRSGGNTVAFSSTNGTSWTQAATLANAGTISGVAAGPGGSIIGAGAGAAGQLGSQDVLAVDNAGRSSLVNVAGIAGAVQAQVAVNGLAASGADQVAVGSANGFPATWFSADAGNSWARGTGTPASALSRPGLQELTGVTHGAAGWVAVGGVRADATQHPVVVTSASGRAWQAADNAPAFAGAGLFTTAAAAGRPGYVIVGRQVTGGRTIAAAWWSAGLTGWQRAADASPGALDGAGTARQMQAVAAGAGGFVAVGSAGAQPAAWTSANGRTWRMAGLPMPSGATKAQLEQVAVNGGRVVAIGMSATADGQTAPFAAVSVNGGTTWTESLLPTPNGAAAVNAVAATGTGFTATGNYGTGGRQDVVIWTSTDGLTWKINAPTVPGLGGPGTQQITALAVSGSTLTGAGFTATPASETPTLWRSPIRG